MTLRDTWANGEQFNASDMNELIDTTLAAYVKPSGGVPKTDMASAVQTSLGKADSAVQSVSSTSIAIPSGSSQFARCCKLPLLATDDTQPCNAPPSFVVQGPSAMMN